MDVNVNKNKNNDGQGENLSAVPSSGSGLFFGKFKALVQSDNRIIRAIRYIVYRLWRITAEATALVVGICIIWGFAANYLTVNKRVDITFLTENFSLWFAQAFAGQGSEIGALNLEFLPETNSLKFDAINVRITDANELEIQNLESLQITFDFHDALKGRFNPQTVQVSGGSLTWRRNDDHDIIMGLGTPETVGRFATFVNTASKTKRDATSNPFGQIESVRVEGTKIYVEDVARDLHFSIENADLMLRTSGPATTESEVKLSGDLFGAKGAGNIDISALYTEGFKDVDLDVRFKDLDLSEIAPKTGRFHELSDIAIPLDGKVLVKSTASVGLENVVVDIKSGNGQVTVFGLNDYLDSAVLKASYNVETQSVQFDEIDIQSQRLKTEGRLSLTNVGTPSNFFRTNNLGISANLTNSFIDLSAIFDAPFSYDSIAVTGSWLPSDKAFDLSEVRLGGEDYGFDGGVRLGFGPSGKINRISGNVTKTGVFSTERFKTYWPTEFVPGARRWIFKGINGGQFENLSARFDLDEYGMRGAALRDDQLLINFKLAGADVKYMDHMPPYLNVDATGILLGNKLDVFTKGGTVGKLTVSDGKVNIPVLRPKGGDFTIDVNGFGEVPEMLRLIDNKPFEYTSRYGVVPESFGGQGDITLKVTRPLLEFFEPDQMTYEVTGEFKDAFGPFKLRDHQLNNGHVKLKADRNGMQIFGPVTLGPWKADLSVIDVFETPRPPTRHTLSGMIDRETLDRFGIGLRQYIDGEFELEINSTGNGVTVDSANLKANLSDTELNFAGYSKPKGEPTTLTADISRKDAAIFLENIALYGPGLVVDGRVELQDSGKLNLFELSQVNVENIGRFNMNIRPNADSSMLEIGLSGEYLDVSTWLSKYFGVDAEPLGVPYRLTAQLDQIIVRPDIVLTGSKIRMESDGEELIQSLIEGGIHGGALKFEIKPYSQGYRDFHLSLPDAGKAIYSFSQSTRLKGGSLIIDGQLKSNAIGGGFLGEVKMEDFTLTEAPAFAQLLSFASLKGLFDTLSGSGVHFDELSMPLEYRKGVMKLTKARSSGSALGLTADGIINMKDKTLDIDGVLVPAYTANSFLGDIPLIGDILVGKKGEGIVGLNYTIKGPFAQTEVAVNPLSALTPGFLRGIFEPNRKKDRQIMDEAAQEVADEAANPKE